MKNNLGALAPGLGYRLAQTIVGGGIVASHLVYDNQPVSTTANEAVRAQPNDQSARKDANDFLQEELADGPRSAVEIKRAAAEAGFSWATIRRAQEELRIKPRKMGLAGEWQWELPAEDAHGAHYRCS